MEMLVVKMLMKQNTSPFTWTSFTQVICFDTFSTFLKTQKEEAPYLGWLKFCTCLQELDVFYNPSLVTSFQLPDTMLALLISFQITFNNLTIADNDFLWKKIRKKEKKGKEKKKHTNKGIYNTSPIKYATDYNISSLEVYHQLIEVHSGSGQAFGPTIIAWRNQSSIKINYLVVDRNNFQHLK